MASAVTRTSPTAVVGGGITGLMSAYYLSTLIGEASTVYARELFGDTVSWVAGGWIFPFHADDPRVAGEFSLVGDREWRNLARVGSATGIVSMPCKYVTLDPSAVLPEVVKHLPGYRRLELSELPPVGQADPNARGFTYTTLVVQIPIFLSWLMGQLNDAGVVIRSHTFSDLDGELAALGHQVVVTATGIDRKHLLNDSDVYGVRGDLILTRIPKRFTPEVHLLELPDGTMSYLIPYPDLDMIKVGGTFDRVPDPYPAPCRLTPSEATLSGIRRRLHLAIPTDAAAILGCEYGTMVGIRPVSDKYRISEEIVTGPHGRTYRIDTDGPGGSGVTIAPAIGQIVATRAGQLLHGRAIRR